MLKWQTIVVLIICILFLGCQQEPVSAQKDQPQDETVDVCEFTQADKTYDVSGCDYVKFVPGDGSGEVAQGERIPNDHSTGGGTTGGGTTGETAGVEDDPFGDRGDDDGEEEIESETDDETDGNGGANLTTITDAASTAFLTFALPEGVSPDDLLADDSDTAPEELLAGVLL